MNQTVYVNRNKKWIAAIDPKGRQNPTKSEDRSFHVGYFNRLLVCIDQ
jgi:hypothetical protein